MTATCEVLVVGGGPAGSSCAWELRRRGVDVLVLDTATFPRDKVCAGWITPGVVEALSLDVEEYRRDRVFQTITGLGAGGLLWAVGVVALSIILFGNWWTLFAHEAESDRARLRPSVKAASAAAKV